MATRLIICADGTWNTADQEFPTNVKRLQGYLVNPGRDGERQLVHYQIGVGAAEPGIKHILGGAFGEGIDENIKECYRFLVESWEPGAEIFLFGFSRGAYTARSLAGLIRNSGLLKREHIDKLGPAYALYRDRSDATNPKSDQATQFRAKFSTEVRVKFVGVWDTVGSLGVPVGAFKKLFLKKYEFHDVTLSSWIDNAFHALAIDEQRKPFAPTLWECQGDPHQVVEQVWFAGVHSNVGGGYQDPVLSNHALAWMIDRAKRCGLHFDDDRIQRDGVNPDADGGTLYVSMNPFFKALGIHERPIGEVRKRKDGTIIDTKESVHASAVRLLTKVLPIRNSAYGPRNLQRYLDSRPQTPPAPGTTTTPATPPGIG
jgi:uncharacterized protein (DUF2235 family)